MIIDISGIKILIDKDDYEKIKNHTIGIMSKGKNGGRYARITVTINNKKKRVLLHRYIMNVHKKRLPIIDHKNRNTLDNRKSNLRLCTYSENMRNHGKRKDNSSGYIGVAWDKSRDKWKAYIQVNNKKISLGDFINKEDAVKAYLTASKKYHGEFGRTE